MLNQSTQQTGIDPIYMFNDSESWDKLSDRKIFTYKIKKWERITIGELEDRADAMVYFYIRILKDAELAFYIKTNVAGVDSDTECLIGYHRSGRAIRIGDTEYQHEVGTLYERKI